MFDNYWGTHARVSLVHEIHLDRHICLFLCPTGGQRVQIEISTQNAIFQSMSIKGIGSSGCQWCNQGSPLCVGSLGT